NPGGRRARLARSWRYRIQVGPLLILLLLVGIAGCGGGSGGGGQSGSNEPSYAKVLRPKIEEARKEMLVPGALGFVRSPSLGAWPPPFGAGKFGGTSPIPVGNNWRIASVTKTMTATVILQLLDEGRLNLTDPVSKFRPNVPNGDKITIELLLNMRSGLFDYGEDTPFNK